MKYTFKDDYVDGTLPYGNLPVSSDATQGFRPYQLLVSSIASCSGFVFKNILKKQRIEIDNLSIDATVERNEAEANKIEKITLHFFVEGKDLNEQKLLKNLDVSKRNCSMVQSVKGSIIVEEQLTITNK